MNKPKRKTDTKANVRRKGKDKDKDKEKDKDKDKGRDDKVTHPPDFLLRKHVGSYVSWEERMIGGSGVCGL
jgi:hypothetical protein